MPNLNFLRKTPLDTITEPEEKLFRDKLTPDTSFLNHLMFDGDAEILDWQGEQKALQELNTLKSFKKQIENDYTEWINYFTEITNEASVKIDKVIEVIYNKIQKFARENADSIKLIKSDGVEKGEKVLGDFKIEVIKKVSIKKTGSVKQLPEDNSDNESIWEESTSEKVPAEAVEEQ